MSEMTTLPASDLALAADYARHALSPATLRAYAADWEDFSAWCSRRGVSALPAEPTSVATYLASMAVSHARATLRRRLAAIGRAHRMKGIACMPSHPARARSDRSIKPPTQAETYWLVAEFMARRAAKVARRRPGPTTQAASNG